MNEEKKKQAKAIAEDYKIMFDAFKEVGFTDEQAMTFVSRMTVGIARNDDLERARRMAERRVRRGIQPEKEVNVNENPSR